MERRITSIGMALNGSYRNPIAHKFEKVKYSMDEARFFVAAIRALVDLWQQTRHITDK